MRIGIVNDLRMTAELMRRIIFAIPGCEVAWIAGDGLEAVKKCASDRPDLIVMDIVMPKMDGVTATRRIMAESPCAILIVTATVDGSSSEVFEALGEGALDAVNTPSAYPGGEREFVKKLLMLKKLITPSPVKKARLNLLGARGRYPTIVAIGASTGGPKAIADFFTLVKPDTDMAFVVIQHIDKQFAPGLASWLGSTVPFDVKLAVPGDAPEPGKILLAGTNDHMVLLPNGTVDYITHPENNPYRPSVDVFFNSLAENWPICGVAALLTGIGRDGAEGLLRLKNVGWTTFAQDRESCVVYGMPKAAFDLKAADEILSPQEMGGKLADITLKER